MLLQDRDKLYQELSMLRKNDDGALEKAEKKNQRYEEIIKEKDDKIKQLTDQMAWYRRKLWKASSEKYIPQNPNQRRIDFDGLDILPQEKGVIEEAEKEIISYERKKPEKKEKPVRLALPDHLRRETEVIEKIAMLKQAGASLPASTVNGWFSGSSDLLRALYYRLREIVLATDYIQVDESTVPVVNNDKHRAVKSYL